MKESYKEQLAIDFGHEPYAGSGDALGVAWGSGDAGQPLSSISGFQENRTESLWVKV